MSLLSNKYSYYHAHIYFDRETLNFAKQLRRSISKEFDLEIGELHQKSVGPHTCWSFSVTFDSGRFTALLAWLDNSRGDLSILIHALTGNDFNDHTKHTYWIGKPVPLDLSKLS